MKLSNTIYEAYSLVELLVIMMVFAIIAAMGIGALKSFQEGAQYRSATLEFEKTIEEVRNLARNNVVSRSSTIAPGVDPNTQFNVQVAGYYIKFLTHAAGDPEEPPFEVYSCSDGNFLSDGTSPSDVKCTIKESWVLFNQANFRPLNVKVEAANPSPPVTTACVGVFFKNASSDMYIMENDIVESPISKDSLKLNFTRNTKACDVTIQLGSSTSRKVTYSFDEAGNKFYRKNL